MNTGTQFENGFVYTRSSSQASTEIEFTAHAKFKGVYLKHLVTGAMTGNQVSSHLVKVDPHCVLDTHIHEANLEIHEVIAGSAKAMVGDQAVDYLPGTIGVLPAGVPHQIIAGDEGVYILAKFTPALL